MNLRLFVLFIGMIISTGFFGMYGARSVAGTYTFPAALVPKGRRTPVRDGVVEVVMLNHCDGDIVVELDDPIDCGERQDEEE